MLTITEAGKKKVLELMKDEASDVVGLRVYAKGGGCSGYTYGMLFESTLTDEDNVFEVDGVKLILDGQSVPLLMGSEIDYSDGLNGSGFVVKNPQAKTTCGCGSSFSV